MLCSYNRIDRNTLHNWSRGGWREASLSQVTGVVQYKLEYHLWPFFRARKGIDAEASSNRCATQEFTHAGGLCQWLTEIDSELLYSAKAVQSSWTTGESWVLNCLSFSLWSFHSMHMQKKSVTLVFTKQHLREYVVGSWVLVICYREGWNGAELAWATANIINCILDGRPTSVIKFCRSIWASLDHGIQYKRFSISFNST